MVSRSGIALSQPDRQIHIARRPHHGTQAANGLLLLLIAVFVLYLSMRQEVVAFPGWYRALGVLVVLVCTGLGLRTLWWVWQQVGT